MKKIMVLLLFIVHEDINSSWISANNNIYGTNFKTFLISENEQERKYWKKAKKWNVQNEDIVNFQGSIV